MFSQKKKLGIVGGGQLGKMLLAKSNQWDVYTKVLDPSENAPSRSSCNEFVQGSLLDYDTVYAFGQDCDYLTIEIENVNTEALQKLEDEGKIVHPRPSAIALIKDKGLQKQFYAEHKFPTSPFALFENKADILKGLGNGKIKIPFVQKTRTDGYDGKGVYVVQAESDLDGLMDVPSMVEEMVDIKEEISVIAARNSAGQVVSYQPTAMIVNHEANLLDVLLFPADLDNYLQDKAQKMAEELIEKMDICGLLAVEFFVSKEDDLILNEVAPRPHNSGHQTIESCNTSQFEQHLRGVLNLPLGPTTVHLPSAMVNLLGAPEHTGDVVYEGLNEVMEKEGIHIHIYGKKQTKPFRKMGHITVTHTNSEQAKKIALWVKEQVQVKSHQPVSQ
jgi:5-(carboxyamino)imidazole ribonucleotide synthase